MSASKFCGYLKCLEDGRFRSKHFFSRSFGTENTSARRIRPSTLAIRQAQCLGGRALSIFLYSVPSVFRPNICLSLPATLGHEKSHQMLRSACPCPRGEKARFLELTRGQVSKYTRINPNRLRDAKPSPEGHSPLVPVINLQPHG